MAERVIGHGSFGIVFQVSSLFHICCIMAFGRINSPLFYFSFVVFILLHGTSSSLLFHLIQLHESLLDLGIFDANSYLESTKQ
jgi:hypothetical protein